MGSDESLYRELPKVCAVAVEAAARGIAEASAMSFLLRGAVEPRPDVRVSQMSPEGGKADDSDVSLNLMAEMGDRSAEPEQEHIVMSETSNRPAAVGKSENQTAAIRITNYYASTTQERAHTDLIRGAETGSMSY